MYLVNVMPSENKVKYCPLAEKFSQNHLIFGARR